MPMAVYYAVAAMALILVYEFIQIKNGGGMQ